MLKEMGELHDRKQADYGSDEDPFANIRASEEWGVEAWAGAMLRASDKVRRLQRFAAKGELANESALDSMKDIAVYAIIAAILYIEQSQNESQGGTTTSTTDGAKAAGRSVIEGTSPASRHSPKCNAQARGELEYDDYAPCWNPKCKNYVPMP